MADFGPQYYLSVTRNFIIDTQSNVVINRNVAILIFDDVEVLDFAGPFEVFSVTAEINGYQFYNVYTVGETSGPIRAKNGLTVTPDYALSEAPQADIFIIPGGDGSKQVILNDVLMEQIKERIEQSEHTFSVCSGARILAKLGYLDGLDVITHHEVIPDIEKLAPTAHINKGARYTDNGKILTSAGVSAGIDLSFYLIKQLQDAGIAAKTARYMEYLG